MYLLVMVLDDVRHLGEVLEAWTAAGVRGVTILESTGMHRVLRRTEAQAAYMGFSRMFSGGHVGHNTLFAVIESPEVARAAVAATEAVLGDLRQANTGIVFTIPVSEVWGLPEPSAGGQPASPDPEDSNNRPDTDA